MVEGALEEVPDERLGADDLNGGCDDVVAVEVTAESGGERGGEAADIGIEREEAVGEAEVVDAADGGFGVRGGGDEEAEGERERELPHGGCNGIARVGFRGSEERRGGASRAFGESRARGQRKELPSLH